MASSTNATIKISVPRTKPLKEKEAIFAFKGFYKGYKCKGYYFDTKGGTHSITNKQRIRLCGNGFHACVNPTKVNSFYPVWENRCVFALVKQWGTICKDNEKQASKHIKIVKKISKENMQRLQLMFVDVILAGLPYDAAIKHIIKITELI